ncbi:MAG: hypothetical protein HRT37_24890 [Alteromonadaceae bacterium]|nr:hypothetical protein [Alteromonadaceae bacterium]
MSYQIFGTLNTLFIFVSLYGVLLQLKKIWLRKSQHSSKSGVTDVLSTKQFFVSFLAYLSFFIYGYSIEPFNNFIVWPRLIASILVLLILFEIWQDRRDKQSSGTLLATGIIFTLSVFGLFVSLTYQELRLEDHSKIISASLIVVITLFLAYGYYAQIKLIWLNGKTGAIELKMSQTILMMDISTIAFALTMGTETGWPLILLATVSGSTKLIIMYLFRWVRLSNTAEQRRINYCA